MAIKVGGTTVIDDSRVLTAASINLSTTTNISAAGTTQGTATALTSDNNIVTTVSSGTGVVLPTPVSGRIIYVKNSGANSLNVYPASGHSINALSANTPYVLTAGRLAGFLGQSTTAWNSDATTDYVTATNPAVSGTIDLNGSERGAITAMSALDIDCSTANYFTKTINGTSTFTVSNVPASRSYSFTLELTHTSGAITWFSGVVWPGGVAPSLTTGKVHLFFFVTDDGGTKWRGSFLTNYAS